MDLKFETMDSSTGPSKQWTWRNTYVRNYYCNMKYKIELAADAMANGE
jgi:hypothetical protein